MPLLANLPVYGRPAAWRFIHIWRVVDGMLVEHWACRDDHGLLDRLRPSSLGDRLTVGVVTPHWAAGPDVELPAMHPVVLPEWWPEQVATRSGAGTAADRSTRSQ